MYGRLHLKPQNAYYDYSTSPTARDLVSVRPSVRPSFPIRSLPADGFTPCGTLAQFYDFGFSPLPVSKSLAQRRMMPLSVQNTKPERYHLTDESLDYS
jgi:hypothetical protein